MNRKLSLWFIAIALFVLNAVGARGQSYEFAVFTNSVTAGINLSAVANNGNIFVCVGTTNSPILAANTNNFTSFATNNVGGGYLLNTSAWTRTTSVFALNCVTAQTNFIASGVSNLVYSSSDGVNWTGRGHVLPVGNEQVEVDGIAYNHASSNFAAVLSLAEVGITNNPYGSNIWPQGNVINGSALEAFVGVTSFASSNMALCGIYGVIRISPDGGKTWNQTKEANLNAPSLLAIGSDGGSNLVCVGDDGVIEVSTNGGSTSSSWTFQNNFNLGVSGVVTNFNALAYSTTTSNFLAAGSIDNKGLIVMAPDTFATIQWTWTGQTNNLWTLQTTNSYLTQSNENALAGIIFNGATIANSGFFQGISMVVGTNGTVVVGGFSPLAPNNSAGNYVTNVLGNPQLNFFLGGVGNYVTNSYQPTTNLLAIDWYTNATGGVPLETNSPFFRPPGSLYNVCGIYTNWAAQRDMRTGFTSTNRTPFVFYIIPGPPADPVSVTNCDLSNINGQYGMCAPTPMSVQVVTNAENPPGTILVNWYLGTTLVASNTYSANSDIVTYTPTNLAQGIYTFYAQATNPATGFTSETMTSVTNQLNDLPQWTSSSPEFFTNVLSNPQSNSVLTLPSPVINNLAAITNIEPGASVVVDWYTSPDPTVATYENANRPLAGGTITNGLYLIPTNAVCGTYNFYARARIVDPNFTACACQTTNLIQVTYVLLPPAPIDPVSVTNCDLSNINGQYGMCVPTPMSVQVLTNAANPPGTILVNWYLGATLVASNTYSANSDIVTYTPTNLAPGVYTFSAQATNPATGFTSTGMVTVTNQLNELPQWTSSSSEVFTNILSNPQTNLVLTLPSPVINNLAAITSIEPGASVVVDWYTNPDPTVATYENPNRPVAGGTVTNGIYLIPTNAPCGIYNFYARARIVDPNFTACACQTTNLVQVTYVLLPPAPIDAVGSLTNVLTGTPQTYTPIWVDVLTNASNPATNFVVNWYSSPQGSNSANFLDNGSETNSSNRFFHSPTNTTCGTFTNWAETVATNTGSGASLVSTNRLPVVFTIIPAAPAVLGVADVTNCVEVPNPTFTVAVTNGQIADWYSVPSTGTPLTNALSYTPTNSSVGGWTFSVVAVDTNSELSSTGAVLVTLSLSNCSSPPVISINPANNTGTIQWPGNLTLLSTTNLTPPVVWTNVATGSNFSTPNTFTFTNTNPPEQFFRLTN